MLTRELPAFGPAFGVMLVTVGFSVLNWVLLVVALVPFGVVTLTATVSAALGGAMTVMEVGPFTWTLAAGIAPKLTPVTPSNSSPVIVTVVPPPAGPLPGDSFLIPGGGRCGCT